MIKLEKNGSLNREKYSLNFKVDTNLAGKMMVLLFKCSDGTPEGSIKKNLAFMFV